MNAIPKPKPINGDTRPPTRLEIPKTMPPCVRLSPSSSRGFRQIEAPAVKPDGLRAIQEPGDDGQFPSVKALLRCGRVDVWHASRSPVLALGFNLWDGFCRGPRRIALGLRPDVNSVILGTVALDHQRLRDEAIYCRGCRLPVLHNLCLGRPSVTRLMTWKHGSATTTCQPLVAAGCS